MIYKLSIRILEYQIKREQEKLIRNKTKNKIKNEIKNKVRNNAKNKIINKTNNNAQRIEQGRLRIQQRRK